MGSRGGGGGGVPEYVLSAQSTVTNCHLTDCMIGMDVNPGIFKSFFRQLYKLTVV